MTVFVGGSAWLSGTHKGDRAEDLSLRWRYIGEAPVPTAATQRSDYILGLARLADKFVAKAAPTGGGDTAVGSLFVRASLPAKIARVLGSRAEPAPTGMGVCSESARRVY